MDDNNKKYLIVCDALAKQAAQKGDSPVGAIITKNDVIVSSAGEAVKSKNDITCHAEIEAIRIAVTELKTNDLSDCVLYSTHEPCIMCAFVVRFYRIKKVVYQNTVSYLGGASSSMPLLTSNKVPPNWAAPPIVICIETNTNQETEREQFDYFRNSAIWGKK